MGIVGGVGASQTFSTASGGKIYGFLALTGLTLVAPANPTRQRILFHNPGPVDVLVGPLTVYPSAASPTPLTFNPAIASYGGCFRVFANGGTLTIEGECQGGWQALTVDESAGQFTVMDSNL